jgi:predicted nucleotidyltransferase
MSVQEDVEKNIGLSRELLEQIVDAIVRQVNPKKIIIYGSRARGDYAATSDIDIAVECDNGKEFYRCVIDDEVRTLLKLDIVDLNEVNGRVRDEIEREGLLIYEKA